MKKNPVIDVVRMQTNYAVLQLLTQEVVGEFPHTDVYSSTFSFGDCVTEGPVRVVSFAGASRPFPVLKTTMVLTAAVTFVSLQWFNPPVAELALRPAPASFLSSSAASASSEDPRPSFLPEVMSSAATHGAADESLSSSDTSSASSEAASSASSETILPSEMPLPPVRANNKEGVYLSANSVGRRAFLEETMKSIVDAGGSSIVFDVKGAVIPFHSAAPMANEVGLVKASYDLPEVVKLAHEHGLYVIGRFVAIKDSGLTSKLPETRVRNPKTGAVLSPDWVDPSDDRAIQYNAEVMCELAASGIDEVNMDYIRFSTAQFGALKVYTAKDKADRVEKFIAAMREAINRCGPSTKLGLSTFAILGWDYDINVETLGQDVVRFAPLVDVISPMAYPATFTSAGYYVPGKNKGTRMYYLVYRTLKGYADMLGPEHAGKIRPWIQGYGVSAKDVSDQIKAVYDAGACGFQVWNAGNNYAQTYKAIKADTSKPESCGQPVVAQN